MTILNALQDFCLRHAKNVGYHACPTPIYSALEIIRFSGLRVAQGAQSSLSSRYRFYAELERWASAKAPLEQRAEARQRILACVHASPQSTELDLSNLNLSSVPEGLATLTRLTSLNLSRNQLFHAPSQLGNLTNLTRLDLSQNRLLSLPNNMQQLHHLTDLNLSQNPYLRTTPPTFHPPRLINFQFDEGLLQLPQPFEQQVNLDSVIRNRLLRWVHEGPQGERANRTAAMNRILDRITNRDPILDLNDLNLTSLPDCDFLNQRFPLNGLILRGNRLRELPQSVSQLNQLRTLDLSNNQLSQIPPVVHTHLTRLECLYLDNNKIATLPEELRNLGGLEWLTLRNNSLSELTPFLKELDLRIRHLELSGNSISLTIALSFHNLSKFFTSWHHPAPPVVHLQPPVLQQVAPPRVVPPIPEPPANVQRPDGRPPLPPRPPHHPVPNAPPLDALPPVQERGMYPRLSRGGAGGGAYNPAAFDDGPPAGPPPQPPYWVCPLGVVNGEGEAPIPEQYLVLIHPNGFHAITLVQSMMGMQNGLVNPLTRIPLTPEQKETVSNALGITVQVLEDIYQSQDLDERKARLLRALGLPSRGDHDQYAAQKRVEVLGLLDSRDDWRRLLH